MLPFDRAATVVDGTARHLESAWRIAALLKEIDTLPPDLQSVELEAISGTMQNVIDELPGQQFVGIA